MLNTKDFFAAIKANGLFSTLSQKQVDGINALIKECESQNIGDTRQIAYILATVYHETAKTMQPVKEFGSEAYLRGKKYYPYYGRDLCQTTWEANYLKVKKFSGIDVIKNPELIGQMPLSAKVAVAFMSKGWYTGKKLSDYTTVLKFDAVNARRIINGTDKAELISGYYDKFLKAFH
jgi:predicted chitinase